jgi:hypothetical protein
MGICHGLGKGLGNGVNRDHGSSLRHLQRAWQGAGNGGNRDYSFGFRHLQLAWQGVGNGGNRDYSSGFRHLQLARGWQQLESRLQFRFQAPATGLARG